MNLTTKRINLHRALFSGAALASMLGGMILTNSNLAQANNNTYTYTVCYFQKGDTTTWHWGLDDDFNWYKIWGKWEKNNRTKNYRFQTNTSVEEIYDSCKNSQHYYQKREHKIVDIYASDSKFGKNHVIYSNGKPISDSF